MLRKLDATLLDASILTRLEQLNFFFKKKYEKTSTRNVIS